MSFFLAVDAGGTKTDFLLADETRELARVRIGTIKQLRTDAMTARERLQSALSELTAHTGVKMDSISQTCIGMAGEKVPLVANWIRDEFRAHVSGELILLGDVEIALNAAFQNKPGVLILAGTGSNIAGRSKSGRITTAGGWGPMLADQGSGYSIGHEALRALFLAQDEGRSSTLLPAILDFWDLGSIDLLVERANTYPSPDFSSLTQVVLDCAKQGDQVAQEVFERQGKELAYLVRLVIRRLKLEAPQTNWSPPIAFAGSIMQNIEPVRRSLLANVCLEFPNIVVQDAPVDPLDGALWRLRNTLS